MVYNNAHWTPFILSVTRKNPIQPGLKSIQTIQTWAETSVFVSQFQCSAPLFIFRKKYAWPTQSLSSIFWGREFEGSCFQSIESLLEKVLVNRPNTLFAFETISLTCLFQLRSIETKTPKSLSHSETFNLISSPLSISSRRDLLLLTYPKASIIIPDHYHITYYNPSGCVTFSPISLPYRNHIVTIS